MKPLRGGVAPTPPVPNSCENRCKLRGFVQKSVYSIAQVIKGERDSLSKLLQALDEAIATIKEIRDPLDDISK